MLRKEREEAFRALEKIWEKKKGKNPEVLEKAIGDALGSAGTV